MANLGADAGLLDELVGSEVESVVFVRDYLQLALFLPEGNPILSLYVWPVLASPEVVTHSVGAHAHGYRDALRALINHRVVGAEAREETGLLLSIDTSWSLVVRPAWYELRGPEIGMRQINDQAGRWHVRRRGEAPFETDHWG